MRFSLVLFVTVVFASMPVLLMADSSDSVMAPGVQGMGWRLSAISDAGVKDRADRIYATTQRLAHHLLQSVHPWKEDPDLLLATQSRSGEHHIRPNTGIVCGLAFLYRFGPYDENVVGLSRAGLLRERIVPMMRYLTETHVTGPRVTGDGKKWGDAWQSAHWACSLGRGAWFIGADLPGDVYRDVCRVVAHEADRIAASEPPHQVQRDTKAEENAWNSTILSVAVLLMPEDARRTKWEEAFYTWALSAFLRAADEHSETLIDGKTVAEQYTGANIYDDFTLENHNIVHPDYMTTFSLLLGCALDYTMTGRRVPEALLHNVPGIYENLKWFALPDGGFVYPSGQDWALFRNPDWLQPHIAMAVFGRDPQAWALADRSLVTLEKMQARTTSGGIFLPEENFFASAESDKLYAYGLAWLSLHYADAISAGDPQRLGVRELKSAKIILNRTPSGVHSVSWGTTIMAQSVPYRLDRVVSPHPRGGVGFVRLAGQSKPLPVTLESVDIQAESDAFTVKLVVKHGNSVRAHLGFRSAPDGTWRMGERLEALEDVRSSEVATGLIGILNDERWVYERGERAVSMDGRTTAIPACSGRTLRSEATREIAIDQALLIVGSEPLSVYYRAASNPERGRATDELVLNHHPQERAWKKGETISQYEVAVRCPRTAAPEH